VKYWGPSESWLYRRFYDIIIVIAICRTLCAGLCSLCKDSVHLDSCFDTQSYINYKLISNFLHKNRVKVSDIPGAGSNHFLHLKMTRNIMKDVNMKK